MVDPIKEPEILNKIRSKLDTALISDALDVLSISEMGHFLNRTLWCNQTVLASSLGFWL